MRRLKKSDLSDFSQAQKRPKGRQSATFERLVASTYLKGELLSCVCVIGGRGVGGIGGVRAAALS